MKNILLWRHSEWREPSLFYRTLKSLLEGEGYTFRGMKSFSHFKPAMFQSVNKSWTTFKQQIQSKTFLYSSISVKTICYKCKNIHIWCHLTVSHPISGKDNQQSPTLCTHFCYDNARSLGFALRVQAVLFPPFPLFSALFPLSCVNELTFMSGGGGNGGDVSPFASLDVFNKMCNKIRIMFVETEQAI